MSTPKRPIRPGVSRRRFLWGSGMVGAGVVLGGSSFLAACGGDDDDAGGGGDGAGSLFFENWPAYIDEETVDLFSEETGIDLRYTEAYNDNNEYFAKVQPQLSKGDTIDPDILAPTNWMAARYISLGWAQTLPFGQIPNAANLRDDLKGTPTDPSNEYTLPWQTGIAGIAYNVTATGRELGSVADLFDPAFKGKVGMLTEMRDTIGLIALGEGIDISTMDTYEKAAPAFDKLEQATNSGQIRQFTGNDYMDDLSAGNFACCIGWSGDILQIAADNPDVRFVVPEEGGTSWWDTMILVTGSENGAAAAQWMNYVYDPVNAARITAYVGYISPLKRDLVQPEVEKLDPALASDPLVFPDEATLAKLNVFASLSPEEEAKFDKRFSEITGA